LSKKSIREEIRELFGDMSKDELIEELKNAGFNVSDGTGKIIITEDEN